MSKAQRRAKKKLGKKWVVSVALACGLTLLAVVVGVFFVSGEDELNTVATSKAGRSGTAKKVMKEKKARKKESQVVEENREDGLQTIDGHGAKLSVGDKTPVGETPLAADAEVQESSSHQDSEGALIEMYLRELASFMESDPASGEESVSGAGQTSENGDQPTNSEETGESATGHTAEQPSVDDHATVERIEGEDPSKDDNHEEEPPAEQTPNESPVASSDFTENLLLYGRGSEGAEQRAIWQKWMDRMITGAKVGELVPVLEAKLRGIAPKLIAGERLNYTSYKNSRTLMNAVELCYMARLVGAEKLDSFIRSEKERGETSNTPPKKFMQWLLMDRSRPLHRLLQEFAFNFGKGKEFPRVFNVFYELWKRASKRDRVRYMNLAIACSLVRAEVAHSRGKLRIPDEHLLDIPELYDYYRTRDIKNALLTNIWKLGVAELLHVVDVRLPMSEFEWVKRNLNYERKNWGATYTSIEYIMERVTQDVDPYKLYTFGEIREKGGVCRDQAYYCAASAKTRGLPAVIITGDGDHGPHAWVALYTSDKEGWTITGSYDYKTGRFEDPCSGRMLHESALLDRDPKLTPERREPAGDCMVLSNYLCLVGCQQEAMGGARYVTQAYPQLTSSWQNYVDVMEKCGSQVVSTTAWLRLYLELGHQSKKNMELMDLAQYIQVNHVMEGKKDNVKMNALKQSSRKLGELIQAGRTDLAIESMERQTIIYAERGDYRGLASFFKGAFKDYGALSYTFGEMLALYVRMLEMCSEKVEGNQEISDRVKKDTICTMWRACAKDAESTFVKNAFSKDEFLVIQKDAGIMHSIAECWRLGGDDKRAQRLETTAEERLQESRKRNTGKKIGPMDSGNR